MVLLTQCVLRLSYHESYPIEYFTNRIMIINGIAIDDQGAQTGFQRGRGEGGVAPPWCLKERPILKSRE